MESQTNNKIVRQDLCVDDICTRAQIIFNLHAPLSVYSTFFFYLVVQSLFPAAAAAAGSFIYRLEQI
jgi:hypothetical protein